MFDPRQLLATILDQYRLDPEGIHGVTHWGRVCENGRLIAARNGARLDIVELFALLHDACRFSDGRDREHGPRAAELAASLRGNAFELDDAGFALLQQACAEHTLGLIDADPTVQACWDADRLDLGRVRIIPRADRLCTEVARSLAPWCTDRSLADAVPAFVMRDWGWVLPGR